MNATRPYVFQPRPPIPPMFQATEFDGKRLRKAIARKTVDYNSSIVKMLETRIWCKGYRERHAIQPDSGYYPHLVPPMAMLDNPINCVTTKFVRTSTNKMRCPIFCVLWTPEGRRLVTGASSGEFTLWNGLTFNFETILQAHETAVQVMVWSKNDTWMVTADRSGYVKYWQSNMNNVKMFQAHEDPIRGISICPTDKKFATCSDDGTLKIWDFFTCTPERILRGHGSDVKGVDWHPTKSLIVSGSKDSQQPIKLWDPKTGQNLATLHAHKSTVMDVKWNQNGNWLLTASRDHLIKIFDIRKISQEMQIFRGHKKEACCISWHPIHESLFASGGSDGSILFWLVGTDEKVGGMDEAHDSVVWSLSWHPLGHILASGSNDHTCKFWTRNRPGDNMIDKYNLNLAKKGNEEVEYEELDIIPSIPGITRSENEQDMTELDTQSNVSIPGLGQENESKNNEEGPPQQRKVPFSKPVPKQFESQWQDRSRPIINPDESDRLYDHQRNSTSPHPPFNHPHPHNHFSTPHSPMDHPMDGQSFNIPPPPPMMGPHHGAGIPGPPHMRRDDRREDYNYNGPPPSARFNEFDGPPPPEDRFMPPYSMGHHPKDRYPPGAPHMMYEDNSLPPSEFHSRRDMRWRDDDYVRRDEDFRRHNFDYPPPRPEWRRPPDNYRWRGPGPDGMRWRRGGNRGPAPPMPPDGPGQWEWDRNRDHRPIQHD